MTCCHHLDWSGGRRLHWLQRRSRVTRFSSLHQPRWDKWVPDCHLECGKCRPGLWHVCNDLNWSSHRIKMCHSGCQWSRLIACSRAVAFEWLRCYLSLGNPFSCFLLLLSLPGRVVAALRNLAYLLGLSLQVCPFMALGCSVMLLWLVSNPLLLTVHFRHECPVWCNGNMIVCSVLQPACGWVDSPLATLTSPESPLGCCTERNSETVKPRPEILGSLVTGHRELDGVPIPYGRN